MTSPLEDMCRSLVESHRAELKGTDAAIFDLAIALELKRRGLGDKEFNILLRLRAEEHRRACPLFCSLLVELANLMTASGNVVSIPTRSPSPGAKP